MNEFAVSVTEDHSKLWKIYTSRLEEKWSVRSGKLSVSLKQVEATKKRCKRVLVLVVSCKANDGTPRLRH